MNSTKKIQGFLFFLGGCTAGYHGNGVLAYFAFRFFFIPDDHVFVHGRIIDSAGHAVGAAAGGSNALLGAVLPQLLLHKSASPLSFLQRLHIPGQCIPVIFGSGSVAFFVVADVGFANRWFGCLFRGSLFGRSRGGRNLRLLNRLEIRGGRGCLRRNRGFRLFRHGGSRGRC